MTGRFFALLAVAVTGIVAVAPTLVRHPARNAGLRESRPGLAADVPVRPDSARRLALRRYPDAAVTSQVLRDRGRRMLYVFTLRVDGSAREVEVLVDAANGRVIGVPGPPGRTPAGGAPDA